MPILEHFCLFFDYFFLRRAVVFVLAIAFMVRQISVGKWHFWNYSFWFFFFYPLISFRRSCIDWLESQFICIFYFISHFQRRTSMSGMIIHSMCALRAFVFDLFSFSLMVNSIFSKIGRLFIHGVCTVLLENKLLHSMIHLWASLLQLVSSDNAYIQTPNSSNAKE